MVLNSSTPAAGTLIAFAACDAASPQQRFLQLALRQPCECWAGGVCEEA
jgi:hypothetical protein